MGTLNVPSRARLAADTRTISAPRLASAFWQAWLVEEDIARVPAHEMVEKWQRLVVIAPHPDDEILTCGALLHTHLARGGRCLVVAVTDGEASHADCIAHDARQLAQQRRLESRNGLRRLGVEQAGILRLGLPDGGLAESAQALQAHLDGLLQPSDVVVTTWRLDGHPDHEACGNAAANACRSSGATLLESPVWMWHWAEPWDPQVDWTRLRGAAMDSETLALKLHALAAHRSQLTARSATLPAVLDTALMERAGWDTEYFFVP